jgi:hypothetical protein
MKITFNRVGVERLLAHTKAAKDHKKTYAEEADGKKCVGPALWLVGDDGVYLMSNGKPALKPEEGDGHFVVYADQINPKTMAFDDWWAAKNTAFGGDDGVDGIAAGEIEQALAAAPGKPLTLDLTPKAITLHVAAPKRKH